MRLAKIAPWLIVAGWALLSIAWVMASAPFGAADEGDHYVRTIGIADGELIGDKPAPPGDIDTDAGRWYYQTVREVNVPAGLGPRGACFAPDKNASAACFDQQPQPPDVETVAITGVGGYQPFPYLLPAAATEIASGPDSALPLARFAGLLLALLALAAAVAVLRSFDDDPLALIGLLVAVTPMVLYVSTSLTGSGLEATAALAYTAALLRLTRPGEGPGYVWAIAGLAGVALALSRSIGPIWVLLGLALALLLAGPRPSIAIVRDGGRWSIAAGAMLLFGVVLNRVWEAAYGIKHVPIGFEKKREALGDGLDQLADLAPGFVGDFGQLEFGMPDLGAAAWLICAAALVTVALVVARRRDRLVLVATVAAAALVPMLLYIAVFRHTGKFGIQSRHVLAVAVVVPLLAGELIYRERGRLSPALHRALLIGVPVAVAALQLVALQTVAKRYAVGLDGPFNFVGNSEWDPPLGWVPWLLFGLLGAVALAAAPITAELQRRSAVRSG